MNANKSIRLGLASCFILLLAISYRSTLTGLFPTSVAFAQDASRIQGPPLSRKNIPHEGDQENPKAKTAISVDVDLVSLQALVTDIKGTTVTGLKRENFTIYEDNVKQEIINFSPFDASLTVVMLVEYSNNITRFVNQIWNAMNIFIGTLRRGDYAAVVGYDISPTILCDFTQDRQKLYQTLNRFRFPNFDESNLNDALVDVFDRTQEIEGKVAILLISTGLDSMSKNSYDEVMEKCKNASASICAIGLGQTFRMIAEARGEISDLLNMDLLMGETRLKTYADYTGGAAFFPHFDTELPAIFNTISDLLRNQYNITYSSSNTKKDGKFRKIRVEAATDKLDTKGKPLKLKVVTRKGYTAKLP